MSTTDTAGRVACADDALIDVSGYSLGEIKGQPHNLVRHPDMPAEAFADMWATLKAGESWTALVKNRRKNGDHYWVRANATPVVRNGQTVGYMSVRTKPEREQVEAAARLYADFKAGRAGGRRFHKGLLLRTGAWGWTSVLKTASLRWRIRIAALALLPVILIGAFAIGIRGGALGALAIVVATAGLASLMWLEAQIARPMEALCAQAQRVACGDVRQEVHLDRVDEIGRI